MLVRSKGILKLYQSKKVFYKSNHGHHKNLKFLLTELTWSKYLFACLCRVYSLNDLCQFPPPEIIIRITRGKSRERKYIIGIGDGTWIELTKDQVDQHLIHKKKNWQLAAWFRVMTLLTCFKGPKANWFQNLHLVLDRMKSKTFQKFKKYIHIVKIIFKKSINIIKWV